MGTNSLAHRTTWLRSDLLSQKVCIERMIVSRRPSGLRKTTMGTNSLAHRTTWLRSDLLQLTLNDARKSTAAENWREGGGLWDVAAVGEPLESLGRQRRKGTGREWREGPVSSGGRRRSCASCHTIKSDRDMIL